MTDLETRLRGDLAELADAIAVDEDTAWAAIRGLAATDVGDAAPLIDRRIDRRRRSTFVVWAAAAAVAAIGITAAVVTALQRSDGNPPAVPSSATSGPPAIRTTEPPPDTEVAGLDGRIAVLPTADSDRQHQFSPSVLNWAAPTRTGSLMTRTDGAAWARIDLDANPFSWQQAEQRVATGNITEIDLGGTPGLLFQEWDTWVVMMRVPEGTATLRSGGLDQAAVIDLATALAQSSITTAPVGWQAAVAPPDWSMFDVTDQFGIRSTVRSAEQPAGGDLRVAAIDVAPTGATIDVADVGGQAGLLVSAREDRTLLWEVDGMIVALTQQDATPADLVELSSRIRVEPLADQRAPILGPGFQLGAGTGSVSALVVLDRDQDTARGRFLWLAYRATSQPPTGAGRDLWCVQLLTSTLRSGAMGGNCWPYEGEFTAVSTSVDGDTVGIAATDVRSLWFVADGERIDVTVEQIPGLQVFRATLPTAQRTSLHVVTADGAEVTGALGISMTQCVAPCIEGTDAPGSTTITPG